MKTDSKHARISKASALKTRAYRLANHLRLDGWIEPETRHATAERLCKHRIRRIEFPKYGEPFPLSETDKADCLAAGMMACVEANFFEHGFVTEKLRKDIRNAMESRDCLRRNCRWETALDDPEKAAEAAGFLCDFEAVSPRLTIQQRDAARAIMADLRLARDISDSRKKQAAFITQRDFFLETLGQLTTRTPRSRTAKNFSHRAALFIKYLKSAWQESARRRPAETRARIPGDILACLEASFMA